ncbi:MAG: mandelate racemase/muconate lactonizing enzyme family protein [Chromatiales bacterium]|jgi:D-galactarolactone cycloisomerase|nr:mandelate racemase/muconate lactonizing enzyme family protein [Chromatiales bacterium]
MKITKVSAVRLCRPLERPQRNAQGGRSERVFTFVVVETDSGLTGVGDAFGDDSLMETIIERRIGPMSIGLDPTDIPALWQKLFASRAYWETGGAVLCAISAVEVACHDIWGKAEGVPVSTLLGGAQREQVPAYASDLHWEDAPRMAETAAGYVDLGYTHVKTHVGAPEEFDNDLERLRQVRNAIGPDVGFMVDVNTAFDRTRAMRFGEAMKDINPFWYEEPLSPLDCEGHAMLRNTLGLKIATGENLYTTHGFAPMFAAGGCDYAMPDILRCGGIAQTKLICEAALVAGVVPSPHNYSSGVGTAATLHLMAAMPDTELLEFDPTGTAIYEELFVEPLAVESGQVSVPTGPGLGVALTPEIIDRYRP